MQHVRRKIYLVQFFFLNRPTTVLETLTVSIGRLFQISITLLAKLYGVFTAYIMLLIAVSYSRCGRNLQAKLYTVINSLSVNHVYLNMLYTNRH